jgi:acetylglutamate kinase
MQRLIDKAGILIEALPYIQSFDGKVVVVKLGGSAMSVSGCTEGVLKDVVFMEAVGMRPVLVHGGGLNISARMKKAGITPRFVQGLRVTDEATIEIVRETLAEINRGLVEMIRSFGGRASGVGAGTEGAIRVVKHTPMVKGADGKTAAADIGFVGEVSAVSPAPLTRIIRRGAIPVVAPIGADERGKVYNINGDVAAGEIAAALKAEKLVFLSDVPGILRKTEGEGQSQLLSSLNRQDIQSLLTARVIEGGMIPKVTAGLKALENGVGKVHIIDGRVKHSLLLEIFTDKGIGTEIGD